MHVAQLWRYPVKSMAGEMLERAQVGESGLEGDRIYQVRRADGRIVDARAHPKMLALHPQLSEAGELRIDGTRWDVLEVSRRVEDAAGAGSRARIVRQESPERFDVLPLLVATDGAIAAWGHEGRRLRPNILLGDVPGLAERDWKGRAIRIGEALIGVLRLRPRCVMTTWDPDTQKQDPGVFQELLDRFEGSMALDCWVIQGGTLRVGDPVELDDHHQRPSEKMWGRYASEKARAEANAPPPA